MIVCIFRDLYGTTQNEIDYGVLSSTPKTKYTEDVDTQKLLKRNIETISRDGLRNDFILACREGDIRRMRQHINKKDCDINAMSLV